MSKGQVPKPFDHLRWGRADTPVFVSEVDEARWYEQHQDEIADDFERASHAGDLSIGQLGAADLKTRSTTLRLLESDIARARQHARSKGLRYQTYLKMLIHEGLERADKAS